MPKVAGESCLLSGIKHFVGRRTEFRHCVIDPILFAQARRPTMRLVGKSRTFYGLQVFQLRKEAVVPSIRC